MCFFTSKTEVGPRCILFFVDESVQLFKVGISKIIMKNVLTVSYQIKNIIILNLVLISGLNINATAQDDFKLPELVPPSPNASSLGVYGDIPVDKSTGVPNITIPLYTINRLIKHTRRDCLSTYPLSFSP